MIHPSPLPARAFARLAPLGIALACATSPAQAQAPEAEAAPPPSVSISATLVGDSPFGGLRQDAPQSVRLYARGDASRVDFKGPKGERAMLLREGAPGPGWMISLDRGIAIPTTAPGPGPLSVDPSKPCAGMGARCQKAGTRYVAGRVVQGWRYRGADGRGPAGTSEGELWVEPEHGVVLGYSGRRTGWDRVHSMEAASVSFEPLPEVLFKLPETVETPDGDTPH
ncbi:hypothetical protein [Marilutibacter spongiae]|uniref:Uncharacterized protein n=1 Tax=Marilutibacter spongiae TaxID=2025720 RepID=A0A7W3TKU3_9GAMM|nr:hypothetical protein [Lysobacter spongiae]MBB1060036.1 hypothetical protein [Lysobacter spongiae]